MRLSFLVFPRSNRGDPVPWTGPAYRLIRAAVAANPRTVVVRIGGSAIPTEAWRDRVPALLLAWYGGMEGGRGLASVLTGGAEPGGRLPFVLPTDAAHLPPWGQRRLDGQGHAPAFPFRFGLGYTTIKHRLLDHRFDHAGGSADVLVEHRRPPGLHRRSGLRRGRINPQARGSAPGLPEGYAAGRCGDSSADHTGRGAHAAARSGLTALVPRTGGWALPAAQHSPVSCAGADRMRRREGAIDEGGVPDGRPA